MIKLSRRSCEKTAFYSTS